MVYEEEIPTVSGMKEGYRALFENTDIKYIFMQNIKVTRQDIENTDTMILIRPHNYLSMKIAEKARKCGIYIIFFADDDIFNLPSSKPVMPWRTKALWKNLKQSDIILSSNQYIVNQYKKYTNEKRGVVIDTVVSEEDIRKIPIHEKKERIKIVYAASGDHADLFETYIEPIMPRLDRVYGKRISLTLVGVHPNIETQKYSMEIRFHEQMPLLEYREYMRKEQFDIGLAPLPSNSFCRCKYFNKYIEYTIVGAVGIYSNCEPYTLVIRDGINGKLADESDWYDSIDLLIKDDVRNNCLTNAIRHISNNFNIKTIREKFISEIPAVLDNRETLQCESLKWDKYIYSLSKIMDKIYLTLFYLKHLGILEVMKKIKIHLYRRKL